MRTAVRGVRVAGLAALWAGIGLFSGVLVALLAPLAIGGRPYTVLSGSMEPAVATGDVVLGLRVEPLDVRAGDIVTYRDPREPGRLITHRVRRMRARGNQVEFVTKGDANNSVERWRVADDEPLSRVALQVPQLGRVLLVAGTPLGRMLLVVIPLLLLGLHEIARVWRPRQEESPGGAGA